MRAGLLQTVRQLATQVPERVALAGLQSGLTYRALLDQAEACALRMRELGIRRLGLLADNGFGWAIADLATWVADVVVVPIPLFFSPQQMQHAMQDSGLDAVLTDQPEKLRLLLADAGITHTEREILAGLQLFVLQPAMQRKLPEGTVKITYTSGTTGEPKGVCLSRAQLETVAASLFQATEACASDRHLCLTPLSTLLENIGGLYVPWLAGATACVWPLASVGLQGASGLDPHRLLQALQQSAASTAILAPQMLQGLVSAINAGGDVPAALRFLAVGGAPVSPQLLEVAHLAGLPVYEGYGLSECASVVSLNTPAAVRHGTVGKPLPHITIQFAEDGEILVSGSAFLGYLGDSLPIQPWSTGDLGYFDDDGFLHLTGRKKNIFITAYGRNVAPEWVERELTLHPAIAQAVVFGEARPFNIALIVPRGTVESDVVDRAVSQANLSLPDYARISAWIWAHQPFSPINGQLTANGRLKREAIHAAHQTDIASLYQEELHGIF